jgi:hypothetical protein
MIMAEIEFFRVAVPFLRLAAPLAGRVSAFESAQLPVDATDGRCPLAGRVSAIEARPVN